MQAGTQTNQLASAIDHAGNITNFTKKWCKQKFIFSQDSKEKCSLIFASVIKNIRENDSYVSFH